MYRRPHPQDHYNCSKMNVHIHHEKSRQVNSPLRDRVTGNLPYAKSGESFKCQTQGRDRPQRKNIPEPVGTAYKCRQISHHWGLVLSYNTCSSTAVCVTASPLTSPRPAGLFHPRNAHANTSSPIKSPPTTFDCYYILAYLIEQKSLHTEAD